MQVISKDILKKIKKIEITTRNLVDTVLQGEYLSSFKGRGVEFTEVREYVEGDDIRSIDWNVTARMNVPYVKTFIEERELQVFFATDLSGSLDFGTKTNLKKELMFEFIATLGFTANINNDRVGYLGFSSSIEKYIPPKKGKKHVLRIIREILYHRQRESGTDIAAGLKYLSHLLKKRSTIFIISDFYDPKDFFEAVKILKHKHDVIAVILRDDADFNIPDIGFIPFYDAENDKVVWIDTSNKKVMEKFRKTSEAFDNKLEKQFKSAGVDFMKLYCGQPFYKKLMSFFRMRERRLAK
ncbi:MAG: DUF58 domain-containing protein [Candidatus Goldbacteria bacterium]|nr:DUF58 domain-containing protein [Candidatus Goldiibacteriota bacterium]HPD18824.1 DUF58 domain-containing protein [Candidatus Goldiibacteriota bacterium]